LNIISLPAKEETLLQLQVYLDYVGHFQHIVYEPHVRQLIEAVYSQVSHASTTAVPRGMALIFSILSISVMTNPLHGNLDSMISMIPDRLRISARYMRAAFDCLEWSRRRMDHTLENVQALVIMGFLINHIEGFSPRYITLVAEAFTVARILSLHQIDAPANKRKHQGVETDVIVQEIERRAWWYLVATDRLVTIAGGKSRLLCITLEC
jgi:hypothetical protein